MGKFAYREGSDEHKERWADVMERKVYSDQEKKIRKRHGASAAKTANYGWGVGGDDTHLSVSTKVYSKKEPRLIQSEVAFPSTKVHHDWDEYGEGDPEERLARAASKGLQKHVEETKLAKQPIKRKPDWQK